MTMFAIAPHENAARRFLGDEEGRAAMDVGGRGSAEYWDGHRGGEARRRWPARGRGARARGIPFVPMAGQQHDHAADPREDEQVDEDEAPRAHGMWMAICAR